MDEGVETGPGGGIAEDQGPEPPAVYAPVRGEDAGTEGRHHVVIGSAPGGGDLMGDAVQVEGLEAGRGKAAQHP